MVEQEEEFKLIGTEVYSLIDAFLHAGPYTCFVLVSGEDAGISHHLDLPAPVGQLLDQFELIAKALLNLPAQHPQIIRELNEIDVFLIAFACLYLLEDALVGVVELAVLEDGGFGPLSLDEAVVEDEGFVGETSS